MATSMGAWARKRTVFPSSFRGAHEVSEPGIHSPWTRGDAPWGQSHFFASAVVMDSGFALRAPRNDGGEKSS
jgi:hypothetical protein